MSPELAHALTQAAPTVLGARLRAARLALGLTQQQLGGSDASTTYVSRIESGRRRPGPTLLAAFAVRLGVTVESLVLSEGWEDARRLELDLDHAELSLAGGEAESALRRARSVLAADDLGAVPDGRMRAAYVEAAALDALGDDGAAAALETLLQSGPGATVATRAATALCRILREQGDLSQAVAHGQSALDRLRPDLLGSEEGVRLAVTLAAALFESGRTADAASLCDEAVREAERLSSPVARASAYWNASVVRAETGDLDEALVLARSALTLLESTERVRDLGRLRTQLGSMLLRADPPQLAEASRQLHLADSELDWSAASPVDVARHQVVTARALVLGGQIDDARDRALRSATAAQEGQLPLVHVEALTLLGQLDWAVDARDAARGWYRQAIAVLTGVGADREAGQLWFELGTLADEAGLVDDARDAYRRAAASTGLTARTSMPPARRTATV